MTALLQVTPSLETVGPGFAGFLAIFALAVATVFLLRSMVGHLRKVRYSPDPAAPLQDGAKQGASSPEPGVSSTEPAKDTRLTAEDTPGRDA